MYKYIYRGQHPSTWDSEGGSRTYSMQSAWQDNPKHRHNRDPWCGAAGQNIAVASEWNPVAAYKRIQRGR